MHDIPVAVEQSGGGRRPPDALDPHHPLLADVGTRPGNADDVGVDPRHRVVDVVHVGLFDGDQDLLTDLERIESGLHQQAGTVAGRVRLTAFSTAMRGLVAPPLPSLLADHPALEVTLSEPDGKVVPPMRRIAVEVRWRGREGEAEAPVRLTAWVARRGGPSR